MIYLEVECDAIVGLLKLKRISQRGQRVRYHYKTPIQIHILRRVFELTNYPSCRTRCDLAILLNVSPRSIQIWLQNARAAFKDEMNRSKWHDVDVSHMHSNGKPSKIRIVGNQDISTRCLISIVLDSYAYMNSSGMGCME